MWTVEMEHIRIVAHSSAEVGIGGFLPFIVKSCAVDALEAHVGHAAGCDIEACSDADHVEFVMLAVGGLDAGLGELSDVVPTSVET